MKIKIAIYSLLLTVSLISCSQKAEKQDANVVIAKSMFNAFNRHDWKAMVDHYVDSASFLDPSYGNQYVQKTRSELLIKYGEMQALFPDLHDELIGLYPFEDKVSVEFVASGTAPNGEKFTLPISCILTLKDGKIVKDATYYDL